MFLSVRTIIPNIRNLAMKRITKDSAPMSAKKTRSRTAADKTDQASTSKKLDLSQFKLKQKDKLPTTRVMKRGHVKVEYDKSSPSKLKKENDEVSTSADCKSSSTKTTKSEKDEFLNRADNTEASNDVKRNLSKVLKIEKDDEVMDGTKDITVSSNETKLMIKIEEDLKVDRDIKMEVVDRSGEDKGEVMLEKGTPLNWRLVLENLREMRKEGDAPVDSMGCDQCMDDEANPKDKRYQALLSLMLSSQTKDQVTFAAMQRLKEHGCTVANIIATSDEKLGELIYPVGFWRSKVKYIKKSTEMIRDLFEGDIPKTAVDLCKLQGVGPKMAHLCMKTAWGEVTGIGVDTHVHRISNRLGWVNSKTPEQTRLQLEKWLPHPLWSEVNHLLVGFGQQVCQPQRPQCATCLNYEICPFGVKELKGKMKKK